MDEGFFQDNNRDSRIKRAVIAGANEALKQKSKNFKKDDHEILQDITNKMEDILNEID